MRRPLTSWNHYWQTRRQTRTALRLLTLSGVVRPSTSESRYTVSPLKVAGIRERPAQPRIAQNTPDTAPASTPSRPRRTNPVANRFQVNAGTWVEESLQDLRRLLQYDVRKVAWRLIGIPSVR